MSTLTSVAAFSPILVSALVILFLRKSASVGALSGIAIAIALIPLGSAFIIDIPHLQTALAASAILTLSAVLVIVPGLYLNAVLRGQGVVDGLVTWIQSLRLDAERKALILLLGFLPAVESLTGFGVSLFLAVPIFFRMFTAEQAYRLSLLGMNIMPWGTLALATVIGASLGGVEVTELGAATALTSFLVFPVLGLAALFVLGQKALLRKHGALAVILGVSLSSLLFAFSRAGLTETAGILAGGAVGLVGFLVLRDARSGSEHESQAAQASQHTPGRVVRLLLPYILVLALILISRMIGPLHQWLAGAWVLASERVKLSVLTSPGLALAIVAALLTRLQPVQIDHKTVWTRARVACQGIFCFVLLAQLMLESGMIQAIASLLEQHGEGQSGLLCILSPSLGMLSGFTTGSNVGGNALMMVMQHQIGSAVGGDGLLFSAAQNSAAGHAVFASLPIIILVMTIAREGGGSPKMAEHDLLRFTLKVAIFIFAALVAACLLVKYTGLLDLLVRG